MELRRQRNADAAMTDSSLTQYTSDQLVEWLCDYGESIPRVLGSLLALYCLFTLMYGLTGSVVRITETPFGPVKVPTWNILDLATFSLLAISTSGSPTVDLLPRDRAVHFLTATEALLGIALTGLLGFVAGNRIPAPTARESSASGARSSASSPSNCRVRLEGAAISSK